MSHIRAVDAIFQVVRCFDDAEIIHVEGDVDPVRDLTIIADELRIKDIEFVEKNLEGLKKQTARGGQSLEMKKMKEKQAIVESVLAWLNDGKDVRKKNWSAKEVCFNSPEFDFLVHGKRAVIMMIKGPSPDLLNPARRTPRLYHVEVVLRLRFNLIPLLSLFLLPVIVRFWARR